MHRGFESGFKTLNNITMVTSQHACEGVSCVNLTVKFTHGVHRTGETHRPDREAMLTPAHRSEHQKRAHEHQNRTTEGWVKLAWSKGSCFHGGEGGKTEEKEARHLGSCALPERWGSPCTACRGTHVPLSGLFCELPSSKNWFRAGLRSTITSLGC